MPEFSMAIFTGSNHYMTTVHARDAQDAIGLCGWRIDKDATEARVEILEVLEQGPESTSDEEQSRP